MVLPKAAYFFYYAATASLLPFIALYYAQVGLSAAQIGLLSGILPLVTLVSAPLWGALADAFRRPRLAYRLHLPQRRFGRQLVAGGRGGRPEHHRAGRAHLRAAGRPLVHGRGVERADTDQVRVRVRAGDEGEKGTAILANGSICIEISPEARSTADVL